MLSNIESIFNLHSTKHGEFDVDVNDDKDGDDSEW